MLTKKKTPSWRKFTANIQYVIIRRANCKIYDGLYHPATCSKRLMWCPVGPRGPGQMDYHVTCLFLALTFCLWSRPLSCRFGPRRGSKTWWMPGSVTLNVALCLDWWCFVSQMLMGPNNPSDVIWLWHHGAVHHTHSTIHLFNAHVTVCVPLAPRTSVPGSGAVLICNHCWEQEHLRTRTLICLSVVLAFLIILHQKNNITFFFYTQFRGDAKNFPVKFIEVICK